MDAGQSLSKGAEQTLRHLQFWYRISLKRGKTYVHPSQVDLAHAMKCSIRTVKRYLLELERAGIIKRRRVVRGNRYYFLDAQVSDGHRGQNVPLAGDKMSPWQGTKCPLLLIEKKIR